MPDIVRFLTAGGSHGEALTAVIDGVRAALPLPPTGIVGEAMPAYQEGLKGW